ncbi:MAG: hypothetical protein AB7F19_03535 [Candidatus Babeliales bacterium]
MFYSHEFILRMFKFFIVVLCCYVTTPAIAFNFNFWNKEDQPKQVKSWHDKLGWTQVKDASYYQIHKKSGCTCVKLDHKHISPCKVCQLDVIKKALLKDRCEAVATYHNREGKVIAIEELKQMSMMTYEECKKRLDENAKLQAVKAVVVYHIKINRAIFLYDRDGEVIFWTRWDNGVALQDVQSNRYLQKHLDLSQLEAVEDKYHIPLLIRLLGLFS